MASGDDLEEDALDGGIIGETIIDPPAALAGFDVLNLYELYRSFYALRARLCEAERLKDSRQLLGYIKARPDSLYRIAKLAVDNSTQEHVIPRFLVVLECRDLMAKYSPKVLPEENLVEELNLWVDKLRSCIKTLPLATQTALPLDKVVDWFEEELKQAWPI
jgi:hypothetical protein